jgi:hypothetical protein
MTKIAYAWIRKIDYDGSYHRVGCVAAEPTGDKTTVHIAFSLCAPEDMVDLKKAKRLAIRRLKEFKTKSVVVRKDTVTEVAWYDALGLKKVVQGHLNKHRVYAHLRNNAALKGLISEIFPTR